jgi:hypothetical protein
MASAGKALPISAQSRSTRTGDLSSAQSGAIAARHSATMRTAASAKPRSRAGRPIASTSRKRLAFGSPTTPTMFG